MEGWCTPENAQSGLAAEVDVANSSRQASEQVLACEGKSQMQNGTPLMCEQARPQCEGPEARCRLEEPACECQEQDVGKLKALAVTGQGIEDAGKTAYQSSGFAAQLAC